MMKAVCPDAVVKQNPCSLSEKRMCARAQGWASKWHPCQWSVGRGLNSHGSRTEGWEEMIKEMPLLLWPYFFLPLLLVSCPGRNAQYVQVIYLEELFIGYSQGQLEKISSSLKQPFTSSDCSLWAARKTQFAVEPGGGEEEELIRSTCRH